MKRLTVPSVALILLVFGAGCAQAQNRDMRTVPLNGGIIAYEEHGQANGEAMMLIHGGLIADAFLPLALEEELSSYRIIRPHLRGHGDSSPLPEDAERLGINESADDIIALLDALEIEQAVFVGHSLGGAVALQAALDAPERVNSLVLIEPQYPADFMQALESENEYWDVPPPGPPPGPRPSIPTDREGRIAWLGNMIDRTFGGRKNVEQIPGAYEQALGSGLDSLSLVFMLGSPWQFDTRTDLPSLHQPILFIHAQDTYALLAGWFWQNGQHVHLWHFEDGHHSVHMEWPNDVAQEIARFLQHVED